MQTVETNETSTDLVIINEQTTLNAISVVRIKEQALQEAKDLLKFKIKGIDDKDGYKHADVKRAEVRQQRLGVQSKTKDIEGQLKNFKDRVREEATSIVNILKSAEEHLKVEIHKVDAEKERIKEIKIDARKKRIIDAGFKDNGAVYIAGEVILAQDKIGSYSDDELDQYIADGMKEIARLKAQQEEIAEAKRIKAEAEKLKAEQEAKAKQDEQAKSIPADRTPPSSRDDTNFQMAGRVNRPSPELGGSVPFGGGKGHMDIPAETKKVQADAHFNKPVPPANSFANMSFEIGFKAGCEAIIQMLQTGEKMTRAELVNRIKALNPSDYTKPF